MKLVALEIENFRAYQERRKIEFGEITTIIGRNDVGKSTILEALEIFFNNDAVHIESNDCNVYSKNKLVRICCEFEEFPVDISLDAGAPTSLKQEYLLTKEGRLKIEKVFNCNKTKPTFEVFIIADHPSAIGYDDLLEKKEGELQKIIKDRGLDSPLKGNPSMRQAIWGAAENLNINEMSISVTKPKEDSKRIWDQLEAYLPMFALFQSDRQSRDTDGEVQNPLKGAIASAIAEAQSQVKEIQTLVQLKSLEIAKLTHAALKEIDPSLAKSLSPKFIPPTAAKWNALFSIGMETDDNIPLNKRGSGVRRLILVSFFKAEAERKLASSKRSNIIYAVEEPETSQHPSNQRILIESFKDIASNPGCQVILTTHSPGLASELPTSSVRFIRSENRTSTPDISAGVDVFEEVANALGLIPDSRIKVLLCLEGPTDIQGFKCLSVALHRENSNLINLESDPRVAIIPLGGSSLGHWVTNNYLKGLGIPEVHIYDRDRPEYAKKVEEVNARTDGCGSWATLTEKYELECYLHPDAIQDGFGFSCEVVDFPDNENGIVDVPTAFSEAHLQNKCRALNSNNAKKKLANYAFPKMTAERIHERDPDGEISGWLVKIEGML